ncbi:uncharacterized protein BKA55DRAFT_743506 [Fusarium redolens]|uniref:Uncharacterized protein n=1 Tax=Fusarium redolens TaxID=48865 RepID=A0A9P9JM61_FUSRE|nr:uncharacterized protein BKA55DRAFT_743506 [Fusarium redolens]KAH7228595.1 hypothetical protein BKA55DRAFT_743506 [Fusarium redolens]
MSSSYFRVSVQTSFSQTSPHTVKSFSISCHNYGSSGPSTGHPSDFGTGGTSYTGYSYAPDSSTEKFIKEAMSHVKRTTDRVKEATDRVKEATARAKEATDHAYGGATNINGRVYTTCTDSFTSSGKTLIINPVNKGSGSQTNGNVTVVEENSERRN